MIERLKKLTVRFYETNAGRKPVREWLLELSESDRRVVGYDMQTVEFGWPVGMPTCRPLGAGLWEVRSDLSGGTIGRVIFCMAKGEMVLLHAFIKKTQKTPPQDIALAMKRRKEIEE
jgi:phage-related protein